MQKCSHSQPQTTPRKRGKQENQVFLTPHVLYFCYLGNSKTLPGNMFGSLMTKTMSVQNLLATKEQVLNTEDW